MIDCSTSRRLQLLLPFRDAAAHLPTLVADLCAQTHRAFQLVAVDDGSRDGGGPLLSALAAEAGLDLLLLSPGALGLPGALQRGLEACSAPLVARVDADDRILPERLERQLRFFEGAPRSLTVLGCGVESFSEEAPIGEGFARYDAWLNGLLEHEAIAREAFVESPLAHPTVMFRREAILAVGGYRERGWPEDHDLWLRCLRAGQRLAKLPEVLVRWRDHPGRATRAHPRYRPEAFRACKVHHLLRGPLAGRSEVLVWGAGRFGKALSRDLEAGGVRTRLFVDVDPRKLKPDASPPILSFEALPPPGEAFLLAAVGSRGAREKIRAHLAAAGWREGPDYLAVA
ncbi:MAG: glycosyltransferase [Deltaproteobacteria bacterium]|nr:glycosyltransferase [Deltaproteobacteria bacterium]